MPYSDLKIILRIGDLCDACTVAEEALPDAQVSLLRDEDAVDMPAVALLIFQDIPAHLEMIGRQSGTRDSNALHLDCGAAVSYLPEYLFITGNAFEYHTAVKRSIGHFAQSRICCIGVLRRSRRREQHAVEITADWDIVRSEYPRVVYRICKI